MRRMGDAGENLEEQLGAVEKQIRRVEEQILGVEERIPGVEERIRRLEEEIEKCSDDDERKQLRGKEAQLLGKEAQLRDEKAQLRDEKAQLRSKEAQLRAEKELLLQGRDLGTEYEWLVQKVMTPAPPSGACIFPSSLNQERMWIPVKVEHWDVRDSIEEFLSSADKKKRVYNLAVTTCTRNTVTAVKQDVHIVNSILVEMQAFMDKKEPLPMFRFKPQARILAKKGGENDGIGSGSGATASDMVDVYTRGPIADAIVTLGEKDAVAVEIKNGGLGPDQGDSWDLHKAWTQCTHKQGEGGNCEVLGITVAHREKVMRCINQLYEYMVLSEVGYGVLTDARNWYLFKRDNAGCLKISAGFKASSEPPRVLAALSYLVHTASGDNSEFRNPTGSGRFPAAPEAALSEHSPESTDDNVNDPNYRGPGSNKSGSEIRRSGRSRPVGKQLALQDVSAEDLNLKWAGIISCEGWSGYVVTGRLHGQPVALKFAYLGTERAEALLQEVVAYTKMEKLWGVFVPRLIGYGTTNNGRVVFVATELIEGVELGEVAATGEVETAALEALDAVHACGLNHGDISPSNIMVVRGKQPPVRILDFGFSCVTSNKKLQKAERMRLERLLTHMVK